MTTNLKINGNLIFRLDKSLNRVFIFNKVTKKVHSVGKSEYTILKSINGSMSLNEIIFINKHLYTEAELNKLLDIFITLNFIEYECINNEIDTNFKNRKIPLPINFNNESSKLMFKCIAKVSFFLLTYISIPIFSIGLFIFFKYNLNLNRIEWPNIFIVIITLIFIISFHEFSHIVFSIYSKIHIFEIGIGFTNFIPYFYVSTSGSRYLSNKYKKILIPLSGILMNLFLSGIGFIFSVFITNFQDYLIWFALTNLVLAIINSNILFNTDGYEIIKFFFENENLRKEAFKFFRNISFKKNSFNRKELFYIFYLILGLLYILLLIIVFAKVIL